MSHPIQEDEGLLSRWLCQQRYRAAVTAIPAGARVLDLGCGQGGLVRWLPRNCQYYGVDVSAHWPAGWSSCRVADVHWSLPPTLPRQVEVVVALALIEHLAEPQRLFALASQQLVSGGWLVLTTPHPAFRRWHDWGARVGLFSQAASREHQHFLDLSGLDQLSQPYPLRLAVGRRFLVGANQLAIFRRH